MVAAALAVCLGDLALAARSVWRVERAADVDGGSLTTSTGRRQVLDRLSSATASATDAQRRVGRSPLLGGLGLRDRATKFTTKVVDATRAARTAGRSAEAILAGSGIVSAGAVATVARHLDEAADRVAAIPGPARAAAVAERLRAAARDADLVAGILGRDRPRRYLVALQNNAEMRDQGMVLSYAELTVTNGAVELGPHGSVMDLALDRPVAIRVPDGPAAAFGPIGLNQLWESVNAGADFPWSARVMAAMYEQATGRPVDGVWAVDVVALAGLLTATGPVDVAGLPAPLTSRTAGRVLLHDIYQGVRPGQDGGRRRVLAGAMQAVVRNAVSAVDRSALAVAVHRGAATRHARFWSPIRDEARAFARWGVDGAPARGFQEKATTFHAAVENRTATKLDYYIDVDTHVAVRHTELGTTLVRTTVDVINRAPVGAAPSYQLGPDGYGATTRPGEYVGWVALWGPAGATQPGSVDDAGLRLSTETVWVPAGEQRRVTFETAIPAAADRGPRTLRFVPQPRASANDVRFSGEGVRWRGPWDRIVRVEFGPPSPGAGAFPMRWILTLAAALALVAVAPTTTSAARAQQYPPTPTGPTTPPGSPITLPDGTPVTQPDGTPVTAGPATTGRTRPTTVLDQLRNEPRIPGDVVVEEVCAYKRSSNVTVAVNGTPVATLAAREDGCVTQAIIVADCEPPALQIADTRAAARLGENSVTFSGTGANDRPVSETKAVKIACSRPKKARNLAPVFAVGAAVVAMLAAGVLVELRNRRRARQA